MVDDPMNATQNPGHSMPRPRVLVVQPSLQPPGGGNSVAAWMLQALAGTPLRVVRLESSLLFRWAKRLVDDFDVSKAVPMRLIHENRHAIHGMSEEHVGIAPAEALLGGCVFLIAGRQ